MNTLLAVISIAFVVLVLMFVAYVLFGLSPFAHHGERYRQNGERQRSPRLD